MKLVFLLLFATACYEHEPAATYIGPQLIHAREGHVASVREVARAPGPPQNGALISGIVFHDGGAAMIGDGFTGASAPNRHAFQVVVSFDDGETGIFLYQDWPPFRPGERVLLTPQGLVGR